ncbi:MAG: radical SAM protein [Thermoplasmatales archaeon]|nr:radical SAM protein [Thermoplasmatales archaeon]
MRILFISPPTDSAIKNIIGTTGPPLGLAYLASIARNRGFDARIIDSIAEDLTFDDVRKIINQYSPDIVGITSTTSMMPDAYQVAKITKEISRDIITIIGGPHVTFVPKLTLQESRDIDYVVKGEGEIAFSGILDVVEKKREKKEVLGIAYREKDEIRENPPQPLIKDVDSIPEPAWDLLPMEKYEIDNVQFGTVMTSRGCPYNCIFCSSSLQFGKQWRGHSVERVIEELKTLRYKYNKREIEFLDDTFTLNMKRAIELTKRIYDEGLDIRWSGSARVNLFNDEIAKYMKRSGAHTVYFGIESGSQKILDFIGKGITLDLARLSVSKANNAGLNTLGSFIIGFPDDTVRDVKTTIKFSKKVGVTVAQFTIATPYPGTRLWDYVIERGLLLTMNWRKFTTLSPVIKLKNFTSDQILKWLSWAYISFYVRPLYLIRDLARTHGFVFKRLIPYARKAMTMDFTG